MPDTMDEGKATCKFVIGKLPGFWAKLTEVIQRAKRRAPGAQLSTWITEEHARSLGAENIARAFVVLWKTHVESTIECRLHEGL